MKVKLGILGLGKKSTQFYLKELNKTGNNCNYKLYKTNFDEINNLLPKPSKELSEIVFRNLKALLKLDVNTLLIPNITLHQTIDKLKLDVPIIHPIIETIKALKKTNNNKVILFGSMFTMQSSYIKDYFKQSNIELFIPKENDRLFIDKVRKQVYQETASYDLIKKYNLLVKKYTQLNTVVIACTELSLVTQNSNKKIVDMARIQIKQLKN